VSSKKLGRKTLEETKTGKDIGRQRFRMILGELGKGLLCRSTILALDILQEVEQFSGTIVGKGVNLLTKLFQLSGGVTHVVLVRSTSRALLQGSDEGFDQLIDGGGQFRVCQLDLLQFHLNALNVLPVK